MTTAQQNKDFYIVNSSRESNLRISGKDIIKPDGKLSLDKVAQVLNRDVPNSQVAVEGHTDTDPIKYSGWKSNWELSSARALAVVHYLVDECKVGPQRLSANGYGEFHPVALNDPPRINRKTDG
jgi:chemotaxis protein MotB